MKVTQEMVTAIHRRGGKNTFSFFNFMEAGKKGLRVIFVCPNGEFHSPQSIKENFVAREKIINLIEDSKNYPNGQFLWKEELENLILNQPLKGE